MKLTPDRRGTECRAAGGTTRSRALPKTVDSRAL
jgi:hypothetical protein